MKKGTGSNFKELIEIIAKLRDPNGGCPWDIEQTHQTLKPYLIEEAYEVLEAIEHEPTELKNELGDLLLQVVLHSQIASDSDNFCIDDVVTALTTKLIERHPHVFGQTKVKDTKEVKENWEKIKQAKNNTNESILDGVPAALPALLRAQRVGEKAARIGFDWNDHRGVCDKVLEEVQEFSQALSKEKINPHEVEEEFGDLLFSLTQLARKLKIDSETTLNKATVKFIDRFKKLEALAGKEFNMLSIEGLSRLWEQIKLEERKKD